MAQGATTCDIVSSTMTSHSTAPDINKTIGVWNLRALNSLVGPVAWLLIVLLVGCAAPQTPQVQVAPEESFCPEPPQPQNPLDRSAAIFFEAGDFADWAHGFEGSDRLPSREEITEHLHLLIEMMREAEHAAADARAYGAADEARMMSEEILYLTTEFGVELPEGFSLPDSMLDEMDIRSNEVNPPLDMRTVIEDMEGFSMDVQAVITEIAEITEETAPTRAERKSAECLRARLYSYTDLEDISRMLEEDLVHLRLEGLNTNDRAELDRLGRQLDASRRFMDGCRRGVAASREAAQQALAASGLGEDAMDIQELAEEILLSCS